MIPNHSTISQHFLSKQPGSNYPAAEETPHHSKVLVVAIANQWGCNKWWHQFLPPFSSNLHPQRKSEFIFVQISTGTSDNAALFSNSHKLGIHQPWLLSQMATQQLLSGLDGGGIALCQKGAKYKERTRIYQGSKHWVNSLRQNSEAFQSQGERKDCFPPLATLWNTVPGSQPQYHPRSTVSLSEQLIW